MFYGYSLAYLEYTDSILTDQHQVCCTCSPWDSSESVGSLISSTFVSNLAILLCPCKNLLTFDYNLYYVRRFSAAYMVDECNMRHYYEDVGYPGYPDYASGGSYYHHKAHPHQLISTPPPPPPPTHHSHLNPPPTQYGGY